MQYHACTPCLFCAGAAPPCALPCTHDVMPGAELESGREGALAPPLKGLAATSSDLQRSETMQSTASAAKSVPEPAPPPTETCAQAVLRVTVRPALTPRTRCSPTATTHGSPGLAQILALLAWVFALIYVAFLLSLLSAALVRATSIDPNNWCASQRQPRAALSSARCKGSTRTRLPRLWPPTGSRSFQGACGYGAWARSSC